MNLQQYYLLLRENINELHKGYTDWICKHPSSASDVESFLKIISYLLHGKYKNSSILPELLYCSSNLLTFWHNQILAKRAESAQVITTPGYSLDGISASRDARIIKIKSTLTILEYFEVFLEVSANQLWGDLGRWLVILVIQSIKTGLRAALLFYYKVGVIPNSSVEAVSRKKGDKNSNTTTTTNGLKADMFLELRTGRYVRKLHSSPPFDYRDWTLPNFLKFSVLPQDLQSRKLYAEVLHLMRPLSHLAGMAVWGAVSWKPWLLSLGLDLASLRLHRKVANHLTPEEKQVLSRRAYSLLLYLLRSPFYDRYTKGRLIGTLLVLSKKIPLIGRLFSVLATSIPEWQETYSYIWSDS